MTAVVRRKFHIEMGFSTEEQLSDKRSRKIFHTPPLYIDAIKENNQLIGDPCEKR